MIFACDTETICSSVILPSALLTLRIFPESFTHNFHRIFLDAHLDRTFFCIDKVLRFLTLSIITAIGKAIRKSKGFTKAPTSQKSNVRKIIDLLLSLRCSLLCAIVME
jgi:hypothetical protein